MTLPDYSAERTRRIAQFAERLGRMDQRSRSGGCYIVFNENPDPREANPGLKRSLRMPALVGAAASSSGPAEPGDPAPRQQQPPPRFVQFAFEETLFYMDLPRTTLEQAEAERLLRDRPGFFRMADRPRFPFYRRRTVDAFNPVCKAYLPGDLESAAGDLACVVFDLWNFPVDWRFYVTAGAFDGTARFESDSPLE